MEQITKHVFVNTDTPGSNASLVLTSAGSVLVDTPVLLSTLFEMKKFAQEQGAPLRPDQYLPDDRA